MRISSGAPVMYENWSRGFSVSFYNLSVVWPEAILQTLKPPVSPPAASLSAPGSCKLFQTKGDLDRGLQTSQRASNGSNSSECKSSTICLFI